MTPVPTRPTRGEAVPLARLFAMGLRALIDELHERLARRGWPDVRPFLGFALLAVRDGDRDGEDPATVVCSPGCWG